MAKEPPALVWVEVVLKLISLFEAFLPAALVSYNAHLKSKVHAARQLAQIAEAQRRASEASAAVQERAKGVGRRALLDRALAKRPGADPAPK